MIRLLAMVVLAVFAWFVLAKIAGVLKRADIDWTGVTAFVGFVVLAFWLRHVTGIG